MPWNRTTRKDYKRDGRRYESDVTDKNVAVFGPDYLRQTHVRENEIGAGQTKRCTIPSRAIPRGCGRPDACGPGRCQNRQDRIRNLVKFCTTGFLAGIGGVYDASCRDKIIVRFLCGGRRWRRSEAEPSWRPVGGNRSAVLVIILVATYREEEHDKPDLRIR